MYILSQQKQNINQHKKKLNIYITDLWLLHVKQTH